MSPAKSLHIKGIAQVLRPLARLALSAGVKLQELSELLKQALVTSSVKELESAGTTVTITQLSLMTGVHRKDVTRILHEGASLPDGSSLVSRILGRWKEDKRYQIANGQPRILSFSARESEFAQLVYGVSKELNPGTILSELERVGTVKRTELGLQLMKSGYVARDDVGTALTFLTSDVADLVDAVQENITSPAEAANLHLKTEFDSIPDRYVPEVQEWLRREGTLFHERVQQYLSQFDTDINPTRTEEPGKNRAALVSFSRIELGAPRALSTDRPRTKRGSAAKDDGPL